MQKEHKGVTKKKERKRKGKESCWEVGRPVSYSSSEYPQKCSKVQQHKYLE